MSTPAESTQPNPANEEIQQGQSPRGGSDAGHQAERANQRQSQELESDSDETDDDAQAE